MSRAVAFGLVARLARRQLVERLGDDGEVGARLGLVEAGHDIALLDVVAVLDPEVADDPAGRVLHLLDVGIDDELARRDHGARDLGQRRPAEDDAAHDEDGGEADEKMAPQRLMEGIMPFKTHLPANGRRRAAARVRPVVRAAHASRRTDLLRSEGLRAVRSA